MLRTILKKNEKNKKSDQIQQKTWICRVELSPTSTALIEKRVIRFWIPRKEKEK